LTAVTSPKDAALGALTAETGLGVAVEDPTRATAVVEVAALPGTFGADDCGAGARAAMTGGFASLKTAGDAALRRGAETVTGAEAVGAGAAG